MILRDDKGGVIFASYRKLFHCNEALEAELQAMMEGLKLVVEHSNATILLQSDCVVALKMLFDDSFNRSASGHLVSEIKSYLSDRVVIPVKIIREQNRVAHCLANFGRCGDSTACWLGHPPPFIINLVTEDCNSIILE
ncbi:hypothetical protein VPH35_017406 [Triticum aestivum]